MVKLAGKTSYFQGGFACFPVAKNVSAHSKDIDMNGM